MASQPPNYGAHGQDQQYQAYQSPHLGQEQQQQQQQQSAGFHHGESQPQSGPGVNAPLLSFNEGSGRYEAPTPGGGFGGEHEGGYQVPSGPPPQQQRQQYGGGSGFGGQHEHEQEYQVPSGPPPQQHHGGGSGFGGQHEQEYQVPSGVPPQHQGTVGGGFGGGGEHQAGSEVPPGLPPRRTGTAAALPQGQDRSHQVEVMQSYEMSRPQTEDEQNQAILQREFPKMDSSLIAAIYGDSGSLSATRELLQELDGEGK